VDAPHNNGTTSPSVHDGSARPEPVEIPENYYRARCQSPSCRALLGGFHSLQRGMIIFRCCKCGLTSIFRIDDFGIRSVLRGPLVDGNNGTRHRGARGGRGR
jgi:hypothetical protein